MTATAIESLLRSLADLPAPVYSWRVEAGEDHSGDQAVWVWATMQDEDLTTATRESLREMVRRKLADVTPAWVYLRFRGTSEPVEE